MKINSISIFVFICGILSLGIALYAWRRRTTRGALWFALFMSAISVYIVGYGLELSSLEMKTMMFWNRIEYIGILSFPLFFLLFAQDYTQTWHEWKTWKKGIFIAVPLILLMIKFFDDSLRLIYTSVSVDNSGMIPLLAIKTGPVYVLVALYTITLMTIGNYDIWSRSRNSSTLFRKQCNIMLLAGGFIYAVFIFYLTGYRPFPFLKNIDFNPFVYTAWGLAIAWAIFRYRLFDLMPFAREKLIETLTEGVLVFDRRSRLVDVNPSGKKLFSWDQVPYGLDVEDVFSGWHVNSEPEDSAKVSPLRQPGAFELANYNEKETSFFDVTITDLQKEKQEVEGRLLVMHDITSRKEIEKQLRELSLVDEMTGLKNRRGFFHLASQLLEMIYRMNLGAALVYVDMDDLKSINDNLGHAEGDKAIILVARGLESICRSSDILARIGGDEFVILAPGADGNPVEILSDRLDDLLDKLKKRADSAYKLSFSYGITHCEPQNRCTLESALEVADRQMYEQKQKKRMDR